MLLLRAVLAYAVLVGCVIDVALITPGTNYFHRLVFDDPDNFLIMCFTVLLGLAAIYQGILLDAQDKKLVASLEIARKSNGEARKANNISRRNATQSTKSLKQELRAYLSIENQYEKQARLSCIQLNLTYPGSRECKLLGVDHLKNRGQTPAYDVRYWVSAIWIWRIDFGSIDNVISKFKEDDSSDAFTPLGVLNASSWASVDYSKGIIPSSISDQVLVVMCKVKYTDAFGIKRIVMSTHVAKNFPTTIDLEPYQSGIFSD